MAGAGNHGLTAQMYDVAFACRSHIQSFATQLARHPAGCLLAAELTFLTEVVFLRFLDAPSPANLAGLKKVWDSYADEINRVMAEEL